MSGDRLTAASLAEAIALVLAGSPATPDELATVLGARRTLVRSVLADLYFRRQTVVCQADGRHHLRDSPTTDGVLVVGFEGQGGGART